MFFEQSIHVNFSLAETWICYHFIYKGYTCNAVRYMSVSDNKDILGYVEAILYEFVIYFKVMVSYT